MDRISILREFVNPTKKIGDLHSDGLDYIVAHLTSGVIPSNDELIQIVKDWIETSEFSGLTNFSLDYVVLASTKSLYLNKLSPVGLDCRDEISRFSEKYMKVSLLENKESWEIPNKINGGIDYLEYRIINSELSVEESFILLASVRVLKSSYQYWTNVWSSPSHPWKTYWTSVGFDLPKMSKFWDNVLHADALGAAIGAAIGSVVPVAGTAGGAAGGALILSVAASFSDLE